MTASNLTMITIGVVLILACLLTRSGRGGRPPFWYPPQQPGFTNVVLLVGPIVGLLFMVAGFGQALAKDNPSATGPLGTVYLIFVVGATAAAIKPLPLWAKPMWLRDEEARSEPPPPQTKFGERE